MEKKKLENCKLNKHKKGFYLLPNIVTTIALFSGFYSIVAAMNERFIAAATAIFIATILDGLDGRLARMTGTSSEFGAEYDSFADLLSFGLAPALVLFSWRLHDLNKIGWLMAFLYVVATALRLAKFNTVTSIDNNKYFQGLASPCSAAIIAGIIWIGTEYNIYLLNNHWSILLLPIALSILMVSNIRYYSFKIVTRETVPFIVLFMVIVLMIMIILKPAIVILFLAVCYSLSGPIIALYKLIFYKRNKNAL